MDENVSKAVAAADAAMVGCGDTEGVRQWQTIRARLVELEAENERLRGVANLVPSNWLDPLLTGANAAIGKPPYDCQDIERLLNCIRASITAHLSEPHP